MNRFTLINRMDIWHETGHISKKGRRSREPLPIILICYIFIPEAA